MVGRWWTTVPPPITCRMFSVSMTAMTVGRFLGTVVIVREMVATNTLTTFTPTRSLMVKTIM